MPLSTRQHEERKRTLDSPEAQPTNTMVGFTESAYENAAYISVRDRTAVAEAMRESPRTPLTPEQIESRRAADAALAEHNRRLAEDAAEEQKRIASGKKKYLN
jgi:hypothetical protein